MVAEHEHFFFFFFFFYFIFKKTSTVRDFDRIFQNKEAQNLVAQH